MMEAIGVLSLGIVALIVNLIPLIVIFYLIKALITHYKK